MIILSKCLTGCKCRYDGKDNYVEWCAKLKEQYQVIEVCPEELGGLPTPRIPSERVGESVMNRAGEDVTKAFQCGAEKALAYIENPEAVIAVLKARSPSCGIGEIYDGSFSKTLVKGHGVFAEKLQQKNIPVFTECQQEQFIDYMKCLEK